MNLTYDYPTYGIDLTEEMIEECLDIGARLVDEVGITVRHDRFLDQIRGKPGVRIEGTTVRFEEALIRKNIDKFIAERKAGLQQAPERSADTEWTVSSGGCSMAVIDNETDEVRPATCQDFRDAVRLAESYGMHGTYPVIPQDVPPIMQAIAIYKIGWESTDKVRCIDYMDKKQTRYIYEMYKVMGRRFKVFLVVPHPMTMGETDLDIFLDFYPDWKKNRDIDFGVLNYSMLGISKPITATGCIALYVAESFGLQALFDAFDPEIGARGGISAGMPTDLRNVCWAFGHPRTHLFGYLSSRILPRMCGVERNHHVVSGAGLHSSSCAIDAQAALEKMAGGLTGAFQGARHFSGAGNLAVDDLFSGVQLVIDVEIVDHIREVIESFTPHPDIVSMDGLYDMLKDVCSGTAEFVSHPQTARKVRNILPSPKLIRRQKLRSWLSHGKILKDWAREECLQRIKDTEQTFHLPPDKQKALDEIYRRAEAELVK